MPLMQKFKDTVQTAPDKSYEYIISPGCPVCEAKDVEGNSIRLNIDKYLITHTNSETSKYIRTKYGLDISSARLKRHYERHSTYISSVKETMINAIEQTALDRVEAVTTEYVDADEFIDEIITIGRQKIMSGELEVDGKMLVGVLREQGARRKMGRLQDMLEQLDAQRFTRRGLVEGEIVDDVVKELPGAQETV